MSEEEEGNFSMQRDKEQSYTTDYGTRKGVFFCVPSLGFCIHWITQVFE